MLHALIFAANTFIVPNWSKYFGTKKAIALRLEGTIINRFRLLYFTERPTSDPFWRSYRDFDRAKIQWILWLFKEVKRIFSQGTPPRQFLVS
jgi:hypothetical protein